MNGFEPVLQAQRTRSIRLPPGFAETAARSTSQPPRSTVATSLEAEEAVKGLRILLTFALGSLVACIEPQDALCTEKQTELVILDQEAGENGLCHVHSKNMDRKAPCTEIVALMRSELHIPTEGRLVLRPSKGVRYEEVNRLIQSLRDAGYNLKVGYINYDLTK